LHGEVVVAPITNREERFRAGAELYVGERVYVVASARRHQGRWLVRFAGVDDRAGAEALRNRVLTAEPLGAAPEGELWVHELIGASVRDRAGARLGQVVAVEANPAHDLLVLDTGALVPIVFVVDAQPGTVVVDVPEGLLDL
jgi:16S rRNA processing protein RimM